MILRICPYITSLVATKYFLLILEDPWILCVIRRGKKGSMDLRVREKKEKYQN